MNIKQRDNLKLSNTFIEAKADRMTKDEQNFLYLCISQIDADNKNFSMMQIHVKDIEQLALVKKDYSQVRGFIDKLSRKGISLQNGKKYMRRSFFHRLNYINGTGYIEAQLHEDLHNLCLELKKNFTQASLMICLSFRSKYSIPLYLLLKSVYDKQNKYQGYIFVDYTIDFLIEHFQLPKSYKIYQNLRVKFLEVTEKNINNNSDLKISFEPVKKGRTLEAIRFIVLKKDKIKSIIFDDFKLDFNKSVINTRVKSQFDEKSQKIITEFGFNNEKLDILINNYGLELVEEALYIISKKEPKTIKSKDNYLKSIIENKNK